MSGRPYHGTALPDSEGRVVGPGAEVGVGQIFGGGAALEAADEGTLRRQHLLEAHVAASPRAAELYGKPLVGAHQAAYVGGCLGIGGAAADDDVGPCVVEADGRGDSLGGVERAAEGDAVDENRYALQG